MPFEQTGECPERDAGQHGLGQRADRVGRALEEAGGETDQITGKRDVQHLAPAVAENPVADRDPLDHHQQRVVSASLADDLPAVPDHAGGRLEVLQNLGLGGGERDELGKLLGKRRPDGGLRSRLLRCHGRSPLMVTGRVAGRSVDAAA